MYKLSADVWTVRGQTLRETWIFTFRLIFYPIFDLYLSLYNSLSVLRGPLDTSNGLFSFKEPFGTQSGVSVPPIKTSIKSGERFASVKADKMIDCDCDQVSHSALSQLCYSPYVYHSFILHHCCDSTSSHFLRMIASDVFPDKQEFPQMFSRHWQT